MKNRSDCSRLRKPVHGFTLIELLVVISIIALLLSVMMPSLARARQMARRLVCQTNLANLGKAFTMYQNQYGSFPDAYWSDDSFLRMQWWEPLIMGGILSGRETVPGNDEWIVDPGEDQASICGDYQRWAERYGAGFGQGYGMGYAYNTHLSSVLNKPSKGNFIPNPRYLGKIPRRTVILLIDSPSFYVVHDQTFQPWREQDNMPWKTTGFIANWHLEGANSIWTDGHVEWNKASDYKPEMLSGSRLPEVRINE